MGVSNKADAGLTILLVVIIAIFFIWWLININQRECRSNKDCDSESYCGSDFSCHQYPNIQKTVVEYNLVIPSLIIGVAIIAAAVIIKRKAQNSGH
ncbi:hypothetical protein HY637_02185 [Candidatus Woesearchaeota archaeon]|nr:hypothetical protein [Candidatus Woesearchaeota archaeon]